MALACRLRGHDFVNYKCSRCGSIQEHVHVWLKCKCSICGVPRDEDHDWKGCRCAICGKQRDSEHEWELFECRICRKKTPKEIATGLLAQDLNTMVREYEAAQGVTLLPQAIESVLNVVTLFPLLPLLEFGTAAAQARKLLCFIINSAPESNVIRKIIEDAGINRPIDELSLKEKMDAKQKEWKNFRDHML